ncbi:MAG: hypothetical protein ACT4PV_02330 [Planctomycetaceae bacterium]
MAAPPVAGFAPYLPAHRPRAAARWWTALAPKGLAPRARVLRIETLDEAAEPPRPSGMAGLAAPCSLPDAFLEWLQLAGPRASQLAALEAMTRARLLESVRLFASRRKRGERHPRRTRGESLPALDRLRLPLFHAALPLLRTTRTRPLDPPDPPFLVEIDPPALLQALGLPATGLGGDRPEAVRRRAAILDALARGAPGFGVEIAERDLAIASAPALIAVIAATGAAIPPPSS